MEQRSHSSKSAAGMVTASASKKAPMKDYGEIRIKFAKNGHSVMHHKPHDEMQKGKDGLNHYVPAPEPDQAVFGGSDDAGEMALKHVAELMGVGKAPGNKDQKSGNSSSKKPASGKESAEDKKGMGDNEDEEEESED